MMLTSPSSGPAIAQPFVKRMGPCFISFAGVYSFMQKEGWEIEYK